LCHHVYNYDWCYARHLKSRRDEGECAVSCKKGGRRRIVKEDYVQGGNGWIPSHTACPIHQAGPVSTHYDVESCTVDEMAHEYVRSSLADVSTVTRPGR